MNDFKSETEIKLLEQINHDKDKFEKNKSSIIINNKININNLTQFNKSGDARKLIHIGWGNAMINYIELLKSKKA